MQTRQQQVSQLVYKHIQSVRDEAWSKDYGRFCLHFPALLHTNGLCQVVAFCQAKASQKEHFRRFLDHLGEAIGMKSWEELFTVNAMAYHRYTRKAFEAGNWYKRYAEAILKVEAGDHNETNAGGAS